jgi:hypothetical protein
MKYLRVILSDNKNVNNIEDFGVKKASEYGFYDLVYLNKNGASITEDTLKVRVYQKNEWDSKAVLVIQKRATIENGAKIDKVLTREQFDTESEALEFVKDNFLSSYDFSFKFSKTGIEYKNETIRVWVEDVENIGITLELEAEDINILNDFISHFNVKEKLDISLPEYYYLKYVKA